jgi:hypothetical protein
MSKKDTDRVRRLDEAFERLRQERQRKLESLAAEAAANRERRSGCETSNAGDKAATALPLCLSLGRGRH